MTVLLILSLLSAVLLAICLLCLGRMLCLLHARLRDVEYALSREQAPPTSGADRCFTPRRSDVSPS